MIYPIFLPLHQPYLIKDGKTGFGGLRRKFGEDRRRLVMEEFGRDKVVLDVEKIYLSVIER